MAEFLPFLIILLVFWLLIIRPQRRRQAELNKIRDAAQIGTEVVLTSGVFGTIVERADDYVVVKIAEGVEIRVLAGAIGQIVQPTKEIVEDKHTDTPDSTTPGSEEN